MHKIGTVRHQKTPWWWPSRPSLHGHRRFPACITLAEGSGWRALKATRQSGRIMAPRAPHQIKRNRKTGLGHIEGPSGDHHYILIYVYMYIYIHQYSWMWYYSQNYFKSWEQLERPWWSWFSYSAMAPWQWEGCHATPEDPAWCQNTRCFHKRCTHKCMWKSGVLLLAVNFGLAWLKSIGKNHLSAVLCLSVLQPVPLKNSEHFVCTESAVLWWFQAVRETGLAGCQISELHQLQRSWSAVAAAIDGRIGRQPVHGWTTHQLGLIILGKMKGSGGDILAFVSRIGISPCCCQELSAKKAPPQQQNTLLVI